jgi:hypothetical protein
MVTGIGFISISVNIDFSSSIRGLHFHILAAFTAFERSLISERTKEGIARIKALFWGDQRVVRILNQDQKKATTYGNKIRGNNNNKEKI